MASEWASADKFLAFRWFNQMRKLFFLHKSRNKIQVTNECKTCFFSSKPGMLMIVLHRNSASTFVNAISANTERQKEEIWRVFLRMFISTYNNCVYLKNLRGEFNEAKQFMWSSTQLESVRILGCHHYIELSHNIRVSSYKLLLSQTPT